MYIGVIIPQYLPYRLTYRVPTPLQSDMQCGVRVELPSGKKGIITGVVSTILNQEETETFEQTMEGKTIKDIISIIDINPIATDKQLNLWRWISSYYMCSEGEVMRYFLPNNLIIKGTQTEDGIHYAQNSSTHTERIISLNAELYNTDEQLNILLDNLKRAKKQSELLLYFLDNTDVSRKIRYTDLCRGGFNASHIRKAIKEGIFTESQQTEFKQLIRNSKADDNIQKVATIKSELQSNIESNLNLPLLIRSNNREAHIETYINMIRERLNSGKSTLILTTEEDKNDSIIERISNEFNNDVIIFLSKNSQIKRYNDYCAILNSSAKVIVGNRMALGLPFRNLSLIIVTDEHNTAYKSEKSPRIQARDVALMLARITNSAIILDSFAPSVESYYNTTINKYNFISTSIPSACKITPINKYSIAASERKVYGNIPQIRYFSKLLLEKTEQVLISGGTTLLFHNRRGYNSFKECKDCGEVRKCVNCNVSMTYHKEKDALICHYCGASVPMVYKCEKCNSTNIQLKGVGSENIEESIKKYFPLSSVLRLDSDVLSKKENIREATRIIENKEANIIVGTWLTIPFTAQSDINLIGIIDADTFFNIADFRAEERAFQLLTQLASKATNGEMIVQSSKIDSPIMKDIINGDYISMCERELASRKIFGYPPYVRSTRLTLKHESEEQAYKQAIQLIDKIKRSTPIIAIGPDAPMVDKIRGEYILNITLKFPKTASSEQLKQVIAQIINQSKQQITIDVDFN